MGDGFNGALRTRFGLPHVLRCTPVEPSAHGDKRALNPASRLANPSIELLFVQGAPFPAGRPTQGYIKVPVVPFVVRDGLLSEDLHTEVGHCVPLAAEAKLPRPSKSCTTVQWCCRA